MIVAWIGFEALGSSSGRSEDSKVNAVTAATKPATPPDEKPDAGCLRFGR
jgi:hypothetical protein